MATEFAPHNMTSNTEPSPFVSSANSQENPAWWAFDGLTSGNNGWQAVALGVCWLKLDIGSGNSKILKTYDVQTLFSGYADRSPKAWTMKGSNNDSDWDTLDTVSSQTDWGNAETRSFTCDVQTADYRYFLLDITENNGNYVTGVLELYLQGDDPISATPRSFGALIGS